MSSNFGQGRVLVCRAGERRFALASTDVREVCTDVSLVQMPGVAAAVEGVINLRGTLVTIVRGSALLPGEPEGGTTPSAWFVVLRHRQGRVGLGVDEVVDLVEAAEGTPSIDVARGLDPIFRAG